MQECLNTLVSKTTGVQYIQEAFGQLKGLGICSSEIQAGMYKSVQKGSVLHRCQQLRVRAVL